MSKRDMTQQGTAQIASDGSTITIPFDENVNYTQATKDALIVKVDDAVLAPADFNINTADSGTYELALTLNNSIQRGQTVSVSYDPSGLNDTAAEIQDSNSNYANNFFDLFVDTSALQPLADYQAPQLYNNSSVTPTGDQIILNFDEPLISDSGADSSSQFQILIGYQTVNSEDFDVTISGQSLQINLNNGIQAYNEIMSCSARH